MEKGDQLRGRIALVTGAGRRLGRVFAEALVERGAGVVAHYRESAEGALEVVEGARERGVEAVAIQADLARPEEAEALIDRAGAEVGAIDLLVNSASIFEEMGPLETTLEAWQRHFQVNLTAPFLVSRAFALQELEDASIVNILDWRALRPGADHFPYTISKAALAALTRSLAQALAPEIRVNGLALGAVLPPSDGSGGDEPLAHVPAARWAEPDEVVEALLFLLTGPTYITGEILHLDGGRHLT
jgi:pteridine reductase